MRQLQVISVPQVLTRNALSANARMV